MKQLHLGRIFTAWSEEPLQREGIGNLPKPHPQSRDTRIELGKDNEDKNNDHVKTINCVAGRPCFKEHLLAC